MQEMLAQPQRQSQAFLHAVNKGVFIPVLQSTYILMSLIPSVLANYGSPTAFSSLPI